MLPYTGCMNAWMVIHPTVVTNTNMNLADEKWVIKLHPLQTLSTFCGWSWDLLFFREYRKLIIYWRISVWTKIIMIIRSLFLAFIQSSTSYVALSRGQYFCAMASEVRKINSRVCATVKAEVSPIHFISFIKPDPGSNIKRNDMRWRISKSIYIE